MVTENAGLTEWLVPLLGHFDPVFLEVPPEVIQLTMRTNQKYFAVQDAQGKLAPGFICTANVDAHDGGKAIVAGNQKVLARSEEHTSELQSLMRLSYAVFCLNK